MPKFCPTCGNSSDKVTFYGNFCENCTNKKFDSGLPAQVEIVRCKRCGKIKAFGLFVEPGKRSVEEAIRQYLNKYAVTLIGTDDKSAKVYITDDTQNGPVMVEHRFEIEYKKTLCEMCYKKACNYHEAVIQLRGSDRAKIEHFVESITRFFDNNHEFVAKVEESSDGLDMFMSNKRLTSAFMSSRKLKPTMSYTLAGLKNGKKVYKNTYALRFGT